MTRRSLLSTFPSNRADSAPARLSSAAKSAEGASAGSPIATALSASSKKKSESAELVSLLEAAQADNINPAISTTSVALANWFIIFVTPYL